MNHSSKVTHRIVRIALFAGALAAPAAGLARPPDDIARHRGTAEELSGHDQAARVSRELGQLRAWIDEANTQWRRGDRDGLALTFVRLTAQEELVRARLEAVKARTALARTEDELANVRHQIEAERRRYDVMRSFLEGGE